MYFLIFRTVSKHSTSWHKEYIYFVAKDSESSTKIF